MRENGSITEFHYYAHWKVGNSRLEFWQVPFLSFLRRSTTILLHQKKLNLKKSENSTALKKIKAKKVKI